MESLLALAAKGIELLITIQRDAITNATSDS
jgi:hypothetical protein